MDSLCNSLKCSILMPQPVTGYVLAIQFPLQKPQCVIVTELRGVRASALFPKVKSEEHRYDDDI